MPEARSFTDDCTSKTIWYSALMAIPDVYLSDFNEMVRFFMCLFCFTADLF